VYMRAIEAKVLILLIFCACRRGLMERTRKTQSVWISDN
jgi:hypothetical protein